MVSHLITHLGQGGAERYISDLVSHSVKTASPMEIVCLYNTKDSESNFNRVNGNVKVKTFVDLSRYNYVSNQVRLAKFIIAIILPYLMYRYARHLVKNNISVSILSLSLPSIFVVLRFFIRDVRFVHLFHTNWHLLTRKNRILFSISFFLGTHLVTEIGGAAEGEGLAKRFKMYHSYIPFSIIPKLSIYNRAITDDYICRLFTVCRIRRFEKRLDEMIDFCKTLRSEDFKFTFDFFGDGEDYHWLKNQIEFHGLQDCTFLHGFTNIENIELNQFDYGLFTAVHGEAGIAALEVESTGCPLLRLETVKLSTYSDPFRAFEGRTLAKNLMLNGDGGIRKSKARFNNMDETYLKWQEFFQGL